MDQNLTVEELLRYVNGELSEDRNREIEEIAMSDPLIAEAITELDLGRLSGHDVEMSPEEMRGIFSQAHREMAAEAPAQSNGPDAEAEKKIIPIDRAAPSEESDGTFWSRNKNWLAVAAILLFVAGPFWLWQSGNTGNPNEKLYTAYYEPMVANNMRGDEGDNSLYDQAIEAYQAGEYSAAFDRWEQWHTSNPSNPLTGVVNLYQGICLMEKGELSKALGKFEAEETTSSFTSKEQAAWYAALAQLKMGERAKAEAALSKIGQRVGHFKQAEAREIAEKLAAQ